jgi:hypothetical protein
MKFCRKWKIPELSLSPQRMLGPVRHRFCRALLVSLFDGALDASTHCNLRLKQSLSRVMVFSCFDRYAHCFNAIPEHAPQLGDIYYSDILPDIVCRKKRGWVDGTLTRSFDIFLSIHKKCPNLTV